MAACQFTGSSRINGAEPSLGSSANRVHLHIDDYGASAPITRVRLLGSDYSGPITPVHCSGGTSDRNKRKERPERPGRAAAEHGMEAVRSNMRGSSAKREKRTTANDCDGPPRASFSGYWGLQDSPSPGCYVTLQQDNRQRRCSQYKDALHRFAGLRHVRESLSSRVYFSVRTSRIAMDFPR